MSEEGDAEQCPICLDHYAELENHHVHPTQYGGDKDGKQVRICSSCHRDCHRQAEALRANNPKRRSVMPPDKFERAKPLIAAIIRAKDEFETEKHPENPRRLVININQSMLTKLHKCKQDAGYTNLDTFVKELLADYISRKL